MWYQLRIENCHRDNVEQLSEELEENGALSVMLTDKNDDPVLEPAPGSTPLWPDVIIEALYTEKMLAEQAKTHLLKSHPNYLCSVVNLPDQDWERAWMDDFKPQRFGNRLWICPTWLTPPEPEAVNLMLDPGLAFGTGTHPTTALCLTWLEQAELMNKNIIDYGCGSGILALAALKLGAHQVHAVDIDPQALLATHNNAAMNNLNNQHLLLGEPEALTGKHELIIANILLAPLLTLNDRFYQLLDAHGTLVVSGLLKEQAETLINTYQPLFHHEMTQTLDDWALVVFTRL